MNISYVDFWPGFDRNSNWFNLLLKGAFPDREIKITSPEYADIIFFSCFGSEQLVYKNSKAIKILYLGENERPEYSIADYSLSFDFDDYNGKNFRLPHWFLYINWWDEPNFHHAQIPLNALTQELDPEEIWSRKEFCSIMIGNPVQNRIDIATKLNDIAPVHGYGKVFNNPVDDKIKTLQKYRWNICFENTIQDGYVTEKLLQAKIAGCIPLYYGPISDDFNIKCFIQTDDYSEDELFDLVVGIENDKSKFIEIVKEPLFKTVPTLEPLYDFLKGVIL
jgi:hypothetical protein